MNTSENLQRVQMQFLPVLTKSIELNRNKQEYILEDFEDVLTDLMMLSIEKKNLRSLERLVSIVRRTPWYTHQAIERVADVAEMMYLGKSSVLVDETDLEMPKFMSMRILRSFSAICQAVGFMAQQWKEGIRLQDCADRLRRLKNDLQNMQRYQSDLLICQDDFGSAYGVSRYTRQRWDAEEMVSDAIKAVEDRLAFLNPNNDEKEDEKK